jgi:hypothetical protein
MSNSEQAPNIAQQLWIPGAHLDLEYPTPSDEELCEIWEDYTGKPSKSLTGICGVYIPLNQQQRPRAIASIDLCEVVRDTVVALDAATGYEPVRRTSYSQQRWYSTANSSPDIEKSVVVSLVRVLMDAGHVQPVEGISEIRTILQDWRNNGVYCVANTATLPGCERGTIEYTLKQYLPNCFDAIVLPRNHDGSGSVTKANALVSLAKACGLSLATVPVIHIDDAAHHIQAFDDMFKHLPKYERFTPLHSDNHHAPVDSHTSTPLEAFVKANIFLKNKEC